VKGVLLALLLALPAHADDAIRAKAVLSDQALLRLVTCGAAPSGDCTVSPVRWRRTDLTIRFGPVPEGYPLKQAKRIDKALNQAIATINAAGSAIRLTRVTGTADIDLRPTRFRMREDISGEPGIANGLRMAEGLFSIQPDFRGRIRSGTILIARDIKPPHIRSIVLEEVMQSLGFRFDISGKAYQDTSIFAQWGNRVKTISGQDAAILRLYYPE
jgi:Protein of unknown function (DUF2927)